MGALKQQKETLRGCYHDFKTDGGEKSTKFQMNPLWLNGLRWRNQSKVHCLKVLISLVC